MGQTEGPRFACASHIDWSFGASLRYGTAASQSPVLTRSGATVPRVDGRSWLNHFGAALHPVDASDRAIVFRLDSRAWEYGEQ